MRYGWEDQANISIGSRSLLSLKKRPLSGGCFGFLVEAAGIIRPSSLPLQSHRRCVPALSRHCVARLNPLRVFIPKSTANKKPQPFRVEVLLLVEAAGIALRL